MSPGFAVFAVGCAYELSGWQPGTSDNTVVVTDGESSGDSQSTNSGSETPPGPRPVCENGVADDGETAVDCGGAVCKPCGIGLPCKVDGDCQSDVCHDVCLPAGCKNDEQDGNESDVDCGGECEACGDGKSCDGPTDCESGVCDETCLAPTCDDGVRNGDESDVDCGSDECAACDNGQTCSRDDQCSSGACAEDICADAQCTDGRKNGAESDIDCGGGSCPACKADGICRIAGDCESGVCMETSATTKRCSMASCDDGKRNGNESDIDCGGDLCDPCGDGETCNSATDCESLVCDGAADQCSAPSCDDEVRNGSEYGIDCGGGCDGCEAGTACGGDADCLSSRCVDEVCQEPTCDDEVLNQGESDVDCGGPCDECSAGAACEEASDCLSNDCNVTCELGAVGAACRADDDCRSGDCAENECQAGYRGAECDVDEDCHSGYCTAEGTCGSGGLGAKCLAPEDCASDACNATCQPSRFVVQVDGTTDNQVIKANYRIQANAADLPWVWGNFALVYFFSVVPPNEAHDEYLARYFNGPDHETRDSRFIAYNPTGNDWMMVWRATNGNTTRIPTTSVTAFELHLRNEPYKTFVLSNDYSYRVGYGDDGKVVVCLRDDGRWVRAQGTPPPSIPDPCGLIVDACSQSTVACDTLQRDD